MNKNNLVFIKTTTLEEALREELRKISEARNRAPDRMRFYYKDGTFCTLAVKDRRGEINNGFYGR